MAARADIRRARPLLGTIVEIAAEGVRPALEAAVEAAFAAVADVHALMSFHDPSSDVGRLNREAAARAVSVDARTYRVLALAAELNVRSGGRFDIAVAPALQHLGLLPMHEAILSGRSCGIFPSPREAAGRVASVASRVGGRAANSEQIIGPPPRFPSLREGNRPSPPTGGRVNSWRGTAPNNVWRVLRDWSAKSDSVAARAGADAIELLAGHRVRFRHRGVRIDLGGIAKGFAVDCAIEVLRAHGMARGLVNAGGDLAAFGPAETVHIRDPRDPRRLLGRVAVTNQALASTGGRFDPSRSAHASGPAVIDPETREPVRAIRGATVRAKSCMVADALTKVVMIAGTGAGPLLAHYGAGALFVAAGGELEITADWQGLHLAA